jgi:hypothetical protein
MQGTIEESQPTEVVKLNNVYYYKDHLSLTLEVLEIFGVNLYEGRHLAANCQVYDKASAQRI